MSSITILLAACVIIYLMGLGLSSFLYEMLYPEGRDRSITFSCYHEGRILFCIFWPILVPIVIPITFGAAAARKAKEVHRLLND